MKAPDIESLSAAFEQHLWLLQTKLIANIVWGVKRAADCDFDTAIYCLRELSKNPYDALQPDPEDQSCPEPLAKMKAVADGRSQEEIGDALANTSWAELRGHVADALVNIAVAAFSMKLDGTPADKLAVSIGGGKNAPRANEVHGAELLPVRALLAQMKRRTPADPKPNKRKLDEEARYAEFSRLMREDDEFQAMQHGPRSKRLEVSTSTIQRYYSRWQEERNSHNKS